jgi:hypothetical protein
VSKFQKSAKKSHNREEENRLRPNLIEGLFSKACIILLFSIQTTSIEKSYMSSTDAFALH